MTIDGLDATDITILDLLQADGRISNAELAQRVGLAPATVLRRVKLLEERGYIRGYAALLNPLQLGLHVTAFVLVDIEKCCDYVQLGEQLAAIAEVQEAHRVIGEWAYLLKVRTPTPQTLERVVSETVWRLAGVRRTLTILSTSSPHETITLPLPTAAVNHRET
jgi:Lrp/AsnC family transcriptional regulator, leucine-responsive regulatory protein